MEPVSTLIITFAFLAPIANNRKSTWDNRLERFHEIPFIDKTNTHVLGNNSLPSTEKFITTPLQAGPLLSSKTLLQEELESYSELRAAWNGPDSLAPTRGAITSAQTFADIVPSRLPLPRPMISENGEIGLYWDLEEGYADATFTADGTAYFFSRASNGVEKFIAGLDLSSLNDAWFWEMVGSLDSQHLMAA